MIVEKISGILSSLLASANTWAAAQTFNAPQVFAIQAFTATNSGSNTISATSGGVIEISGSGTSYSLLFPASPTTGMELILTHKGSVAITLNGNGKNIDGSATQTLNVNQTANLVYDGTQWVSVGLSNWVPFTMGATVTFNNKVVRGSQTFSTSGQSIAAGSGSYVSYTATAVTTPTLNLPNSGLTLGQEIIVKDEGGNCATNQLQILGNGNNIDGGTSVTISTNYGFFRFRWNGTKWMTF